MARKKHKEGHVNHERWLVSYADFITLLFAFFVVMYSISSVNEGKYRVLAESLVAAFRDPTRSLAPVQVGPMSRGPKSMAPKVQAVPQHIAIKPAPIELSNYVREEEQTVQDWALSKAEYDLSNIAIDVSQALQGLIEQGVVSVRQGKFWLEVQINASILFDSASAVPTPEATGILEEMGVLLRRFPNRIRVEGFTDDRPIATSLFQSNWELSAARAAAIVRLFVAAGVDPVRLSAVGYGEHQPVDDNATPEGRTKNRRVVVVVMADIDNKSAVKDPQIEMLKEVTGSNQQFLLGRPVSRPVQQPAELSPAAPVQRLPDAPPGP